MHLQALGLGVEVEVDVVQAVERRARARRRRVDGLEPVVGVLVRLGGLRDQPLDDLLVGVLDGQLTALLVDQVDEVVVAVQADLLVEVGAGGREGGLDGADLDLGRVLERVDLGPVRRHAAAGLHVGHDLHVAVGAAAPVEPRPGAAKARGGVVEHQHLLRLVVVGGVALVVEAAGEVAGAGAVARAPADEGQGQWRALEGGRVDLEHAEDDGQDVGVDAGLGRRLAARAVGAEVD